MDLVLPWILPFNSIPMGILMCFSSLDGMTQRFAHFFQCTLYTHYTQTSLTFLVQGRQGERRYGSVERIDDRGCFLGLAEVQNVMELKEMGALHSMAKGGLRLRVLL
jgi:hypothetical protein